MQIRLVVTFVGAAVAVMLAAGTIVLVMHRSLTGQSATSYSETVTPPLAVADPAEPADITDQRATWARLVTDARTICVGWATWGWPKADRKGAWVERKAQTGATYTGGMLGDDGSAFFHVYPDDLIKAESRRDRMLIKHAPDGMVEVTWHTGKTLFREPLSSDSRGGCA